MRLRAVATTPHAVALTQPYAIASGTTAAVELVTVRVESDSGLAGVGAATPEPTVTGETFAACLAALAPERTAALAGADLGDFAALAARIEEDWHTTPAAAAALDMALHDLRARALGTPLVTLLGRAHQAMPTSVTIGILPCDESVAQAASHVAHGFRALKLKIGRDLGADLERVAAIRERVGDGVALRVDANCGFRPADVAPLVAACERHDVELVEQPCPPGDDAALAALPAAARRRLVADESIHTPADALRLAHAAGGAPLYGGYVVKLMKCGGVTPALRIAAIAESAGIDLMWGCMDESVVGIAAALHAAYASPATRWLDLDGSFDLARDPARGGFLLVAGRLTTLPAPGLGAELFA
ncbi:MAG: dipeptide epimerase [Thermoanaerobaculia bacterium]|nr:dipeptide epimerase [Thermoanaerobaculia bacterium]